MSHRNLSKADWRVWVSGIDDPERPTENTALKNIRDTAKLRAYEKIMRAYGKNLAQTARGKRHRVSRIHDISEPARPAHHELYEQGNDTLTNFVA